MQGQEMLEMIKRRRSIRRYEERQLPDAALSAVLEAGLYAPFAVEPSSRLTVVQNPALLARINREAKEAAQMTGMVHLEALGRDEGFDCLYGAPTLILISDYEHSISPEVNCAAVAQNVLLAAEALGLGACWIYFALQAFYGAGAFALKRDLGLPSGHKTYVSVAIGYKAEQPPAPTASRVEGRVHWVR